LPIQVDPSTRRLQLVDATGGVDIVIPDLPLTWNPNEIFEVCCPICDPYFLKEGLK